MTSMNQEVKAWLAAAAEDHECARELDPRHRGPVAHHLQQAAEKLLKALLVAAEIEPSRTHDLKELWALLSKRAVIDEMTPKTAEILTMLSRFNWLGRHPLGRAAPSENILVREIEQAFEFVGSLEDKITDLLERGPMEVDDERILPELDVAKTRARLVARKQAIHERILRSLRNVVEAGVLPDGVRMFLFGSRTKPMTAGAGSDVDVLFLGRMTTSERLAIEEAIREALPDFGLDVLYLERETELSGQGRRVLAQALEIKTSDHPVVR